MILDDIIKQKEFEIADLSIPNLDDLIPSRNFKNALARSEKMKLIAEIKKQSPSAGIIRQNFDPAELAKTYEKAGASALSVLTDNKFFGGSLEDLKKAREACSLPVLRKDFIIDEKQIYESKAAGADAILLICKILGFEKLVEFLKITKELEMDALVETHNSDEVEMAFMANAQIIGINNRDLKIFRVDFKNTLKLIERYPDLKTGILISESGIKKPKQVHALKEAGVSAILVGESLLKSPDITKKIKELINA
jgi:indole-3-glycerol phosphate synthase